MLESLIATSLFALLVSLVLFEISASRSRQQGFLQQAEAYQVAKLALQTKVNQLDMNGEQVEIIHEKSGLRIYHEGEVLVEIHEK